MHPEKIFDFFASLKLSVVVLCLAIVLVFVGTLAQVKLGLYQAQAAYFQSFFVYWSPGGTGWRIPVFPGGYTIGLLMLANLVAAQIRTFEWSVARFGLLLVHGGLILLLIGQLVTDLFAVESTLHLREGQTKNYSQMDSVPELAVIERTSDGGERVFAFGARRLASGAELQHPELPFVVRVQDYFPNSAVAERRAEDTGAPAATRGFGPQITVRPLPLETQMNRRNLPSAIVELRNSDGRLGTWVLSFWIERPQPVTVAGREFALVLRPTRLYKEYSIHLIKFTHEVYPGTDIPKDFSSLVRVQNPRTGEDRQVRIYMNNPLRYGGETYYQASYDTDDKGTVLQVVRNPGWLTPYVSCTLISLGLAWQFLIHLVPFLKRKVAR